MSEPNSEQQVVEQFQEMRQELQQLQSKLEDLDSDAQEHELVMKTLEPMEPSRKAYRLIGDVLVERTVAEVLPAVKSNRQQLDGLVEKLQEQIKLKAEALEAFQQKYKIRVRSGAEAGDDDRKESKALPEKEAGSSSAAQGVLV